MAFCKQYLPEGTEFYSPNLTWPNHNTIATYTGLGLKHYSYYDAKIKDVNVDSLLKDLSAAPNGSLICLHVCAHNPTGCDLDQASWRKVLAVV